MQAPPQFIFYYPTLKLYITCLGNFYQYRMHAALFLRYFLSVLC